MDGQGNLERTWKVREKSGNLKMNGYGRLRFQKIYLFCSRESDPSPSTLGATLKGKNLLSWGANSFL